MKKCQCPSPYPPLAPGVQHNAYMDPDSPNVRILFFHNIGRCSECGGRVVWYSTADLDRNWSWAVAKNGNHVEALSASSLYKLIPLRRRLANPGRGQFGIVLWSEGESDADAASRGFGVTTTSHHGGAGKATPEQAEHFRGFRGRVLIGVDRDDAGAACGARRYDLLRAVGLPERRLHLVRAADGVLAGGGGCGSGVICRCPTACPVPSKQWRGADLRDHVDAGYGLRDLVRIRRSSLEKGAERFHELKAAGWAYGGPPPPPGMNVSEWNEINAQSRAAIRANLGEIKMNVYTQE